MPLPLLTLHAGFAIVTGLELLPSKGPASEDMVQFLLANPALRSYLPLAKPPRIHAVEETMDKLDNRALCTCWCAQGRRSGKHCSNAHDCANRASAERGSRHVCTSPREKYCSEEILGGRVRCS